jgi:hypothetical protein
LQCVGFATPSAVDAFGSAEECVGTLGVEFGPGQLVTGGEPQCGVGGVTALENQFWDSRKACAFSGLPEPGTATIKPTCDVSTAMVPTTRTPRPGAGLVEEPTAARPYLTVPPEIARWVTEFGRCMEMASTLKPAAEVARCRSRQRLSISGVR